MAQRVKRKKDDKWIQEAIKKPGSLRATAKKAGATTKSGKISKEWLEKKVRSGKGKTAKRARLALTLRKLSKKR